MYLLILESIGTSELILIGLVALIVFGPRKLPELMRTFGKSLAEFKRTTNDFKESWEKEVDLESFAKTESVEQTDFGDQTISRQSPMTELKLSSPEIKEISADEFDKHSANAEANAENERCRS